MNGKLRADGEWIIRSAIEAVKPDEAVRRALKNVTLSGNVYLVAVGKAAWQMAAAAVTGFIAKENVVGTLAVCFVGLENLIDTEELALMEGAGTEVASAFAITKVAALAYLMFNLFTPPCFAAMGAMNSEMRSAKWLWGGIGFQMGVGFTVSFLVYQIGTLVTTVSFGKGFIGGLIAVLVFVAIIVALIVKTNKRLKEEKANKIKKQTVTK